MKILIMGTGAVGGYFGAKLAQAGNDVVFVARGDNLRALESRGIRVEGIDGDFAVRPVNAVATAAAAGLCDVALVCVKSYDTESAATAIVATVGPDTIVISLQNGIENEAILCRVLGLPDMLGALTHIGAELVAPGVVRHDSGGRLIFGEADGSVSPRALRLAKLLADSRVDHRLSRHIDLMLWDKLAWNSAFNAATAITRRTVGELLAHPDGPALVRAAMLEVVAVARATGVALEAERVDPEIERSAADLGSLRTSMLQDLERGRPLEVEALNGAVIRAAERACVPVPAQRVLYGALAHRLPAAPPADGSDTASRPA